MVNVLAESLHQDKDSAPISSDVTSKHNYIKQGLPTENEK